MYSPTTPGGAAESPPFAGITPVLVHRLVPLLALLSLVVAISASAQGRFAAQVPAGRARECRKGVQQLQPLGKVTDCFYVRRALRWRVALPAASMGWPAQGSPVFGVVMGQ